MSRAFINEDQQVDTPFVPPRADLPKGVTNYVTPEGFEALLKEKEELLERLKELNEGEEHGKLTEIKILHIELQMLENRIITANIIEHEEQDKQNGSIHATDVTVQTEHQQHHGSDKRKRNVALHGAGEYGDRGY